MQDTFETNRYVPAKDVAVTIRGRLKAQWPGVKFSVRTEHHTAINIRWVDGPTADKVDRLVGDLKGGYFDGMQDLYIDEHTLYANPDGSVERVHSMAHYIFTHREISTGWRREIFELFGGLIGRDLGDPEDWGVWQQKVPLAVRRYGDDVGELLRMVDSDADYLSSVFHQYTGTRDRGV